MNARKLTLGLTIAIGVLTVTLALGIFLQNSQRTSTVSHDFFAGLKLDLLSDIQVSRDGKSVHLSKSGSNWWVDRDSDALPVQSQRVDTLQKALASIDLVGIAANSAASQDSLGVSDAKAAKIVVTDSSGQSKTLLLGESSSNSDELYIREQGLDTVYRAKPGLMYYVIQDANYWSERKIFDDKATVDAVAGAVLKVKDKTYEFYKTAADKTKAAAWEIKGQNIDPAKIEAFIRDLSQVEGDELVVFDKSVTGYVPKFSWDPKGAAADFGTIQVLENDKLKKLLILDARGATLKTKGGTPLAVSLSSSRLDAAILTLLK